MTHSIDWSFEDGDWQTCASGSGGWQAAGGFAATTGTGAPGSRILYRDVRLDAPGVLHLTLFYDNNARELASPASLDCDRCLPNQQFRVEIMDPAAPIDSLAPRDVLATVFRTERGDRDRIDPLEIAVDLSPWTGRTIRLRCAQVDNRGPLRAAVGELRLEEVGLQAVGRDGGGMLY